MNLKIKQIAEMLDAEVEGDENILIQDVAKIEEAQPGSITFLANPKYSSFINTTLASAVIVERQFSIDDSKVSTFLRVDNPYLAFSKLLYYIASIKRPPRSGVDKLAFVAESAVLGQDVYIGAFSYIGNQVNIGAGAQIYPQVYLGDHVSIGKNTIIYPNTTIYQDCVIGDHCVIHSGATIGSDGFGFAPQEDGSYMKIPQIGNVILGNHVEIGANTTIDRATMGNTRIEDGVKLDNLIQIAHNVEIGEHTAIAAQTGVSGSTKIGKGNVIGGQVGIVGHIQLADYTQIGAKSGISKSIKTEKTSWRGIPAQPYVDQLRTEVLIRKLSTMEKRLSELEQKLRDKSE